ncbi:hypothetical protein CK556_01180 [Mesoplasma chauliocola]|uniref:Uncharacterized protein n=1 Tax=Mesoplasma chauliocola TaxID=216427 RepID=A0A249SMZ8_9MOLU|nr:hypothetical protein [Mesoplasma chauliocola]ASZ08969.1 hypothetical protein CK556_01180 [Mesoplasma chauliocola]
MENSTNTLPSWGIAILIVVFFIALIIGCWGFLSSFKLKRKQEINFSMIVWNKLFKDKKAIKVNYDFEINHGIFALTFSKVDKKDFFLPIYIFKTENFKKDSRELISKIIENDFPAINQYMNENSKTLNELFFVFLEKEATLDKLNEWIEKTNSKSRGFNT